MKRPRESSSQKPEESLDERERETGAEWREGRKASEG